MLLCSNLGLETYVFCILFSVLTLCHCGSDFLDDLITVSGVLLVFLVLAFQRGDKKRVLS